MWSLLYIVLIALALAELGLIAWTANFLRKYAFRPNAHRGHFAPAHGGTQFARIRAEAANQDGELFGRSNGAKRR